MAYDKYYKQTPDILTETDELKQLDSSCAGTILEAQASADNQAELENELTEYADRLHRKAQSVFYA